eukprot:254891-Prorocentrum_lima.AAC.1
MTSSLVGSEMCIRDRYSLCTHEEGRQVNSLGKSAARVQPNREAKNRSPGAPTDWPGHQMPRGGS